MHCQNPTCAQVCPADAIKQTPDGVVQSSLKPRCIGCQNCVLACPFGVPKYGREGDQMLKCDMCYDRTSVGQRPMCATVCPSEALYFGSLEEWKQRRKGVPTNTWRFGRQTVTTAVYMVMPEKAPPLEPTKQEVRIDIRLGDIGVRSTEEAKT
jgi:Fe-S-cluster-containing dehydrogenase component